MRTPRKAKRNAQQSHDMGFVGSVCPICTIFRPPQRDCSKMQFILLQSLFVLEKTDIIMPPENIHPRTRILFFRGVVNEG